MINVYLDLDGVIFDFMPKYKALLGEWDVPDKTQNFTKAIYEHKIFENLSLLPNALSLVRTLKNLNGVHVEILSSTGSPNNGEQQLEVIRQKRKALAKHNIMFHDNYTIHKGNKKLFASAKSILIDDHITNVNEFTQAGGYGILYTDGMSFQPIIDLVDYVLHKENIGIY